METKPRVDEKSTIQLMKQRMHYLMYYSANIRLQSILSDQNRELQVEDGVGEYLKYSKSIIQIASRKKYPVDRNVVLDAMQRQQKNQDIRKRKDAQAYLLLEGIAQLKEKEKEFLLDIYVRQYPKKVILQKAGGIVESTFHRRLHKALLHLAYILHYEVYT